MEVPPSLEKRIDEDKGLAKTRKYVLVVSLILLGLLFSGAKVTEANTFILKLSFSNSEGIADLLLLSLAYLMVRYHSNAAKYHLEIHQDWTNRLLKMTYFYNVCEHTDGETGFVVEIAPEYAGYNDEEFRHDKYTYLEVKFRANWFLNSMFQYDLHTSNGHVQNKKIYLFQITKLKKSFVALWLVVKCWFDAQVRYRESLNIHAPYLIFFVTAFSAIINKLF
jgi:hypothetical protein